MKWNLHLRTVLLVTLFFFGQSLISYSNINSRQANSNQETTKTPTRSRKLRLGMVGYLPLPAGYEAYLINRTVDAKWGYLVSSDNRVKIDFSSGMVPHPLIDAPDTFLWIKRENIEKWTLSYGLKNEKDKEIIAATLPGVDFIMVVEHKEDVDRFLEIVRSYKMEQCDDDCELPQPKPQSNKRKRRSVQVSLVGTSEDHVRAR